MNPARAFSHIPPSVQGHFRIHFYAAVDRLVAYIDRLELAAGPSAPGIASRYPFLEGYRNEIQLVRPSAPPNVSSWDWWEREIDEWERTADGVHLPLSALDLDRRAYVALLLFSLVDVDSRFGTLFGEVQAPLPYRRPCLETVGHMLAEDGWTNGLNAWSVCQPLLSAGVAEVTNPEAPRSEWLLRVPASLWDLVTAAPTARMESGIIIHSAQEFPSIEALVLPVDFVNRLSQAPMLVRQRQVRGLIVRGMHGSERLDVLGAVARVLDCGIAEVNVNGPGASDGEASPSVRSFASLGALCSMARCWPVFNLDLGPGETADLPVLAGYDGPVGVILGLEGGVRGPVADKALTLHVPLPGRAERERLWRESLGDDIVDKLPGLTEGFHLAGGYIRQAAGLARAQARLDGHSTLTLADVRVATRSLNRQLLDSLATRLDGGGVWTDLVVNEVTALKLRELELRCHYRERLREALGVAFQSTSNRGVRALFSGSSGTGKSLAARTLAAVLGMDIYRVDLSAVVNKYIGETEKNLHRVLSRAEELDVVLLLDEGDSLLGSRTDVKSANDRYANLETNYLLQRLENYEGIVVITTNASQSIDRAFQRRIDIVVNFVPPTAIERWSIWQLHLPQEHEVGAPFLADVASRCSLTGGQIRNAALAATLTAISSPEGVLRSEHLTAAIEGEYRKAGALCPLRHDGRTREAHGGIEAFMSTFN